MDNNETEPSVDYLAQTWRGILAGDKKAWVLFEHGTCVIFTNAGGDLARQAAVLLAEWGPVHAGTPAGDFSVVELESHPGWVVTCHHPDILTYVDPEEVGLEPDEFTIGLLGRGKRDQDAHDLHIVRIEQSGA